MRQLSWLHVSDLHIKSEGDGFSQREACSALTRHIANAGDPLPQIDFVLVTGDVAYSGLAEQYVLAENTLRDLSNVLGVPPAKFFFVPGNHDVNRSVNWLAYEGAKSFCAGELQVDRLLCDQELKSVLDRQSQFWDFVCRFTNGQQRRDVPSGLGYATRLFIEELPIEILGLNSAWLCGCDGEDGKLLMGERQIIELVEETREDYVALRLALAHHPMDCLVGWDRAPCAQQLLPFVDFFHRGHLHQSEVSLGATPQHPCLLVAAGATHVTRIFRNSFTVVSVELDTGECHIEHRDFSQQSARYELSGTTSATVALRGEIPGGLGELLEALVNVAPEAKQFAGYMSGLIAGLFEEVPVELNGSFAFVVAGSIGPPSPETREFLSLRNRLRLYSSEKSVLARVRDHEDRVRNFANLLNCIASRSLELSNQLREKNSVIGVETNVRMAPTNRPRALAFLERLAQECDWGLLEVEARRFEHAGAVGPARGARHFLSEALLHSEEAEKKNEGISIARELVNEPTAGLDEYRLASAAAEVAADGAWSLELARVIVERWGDRPDIRQYLSSLALRLGSAELRALLANPTGSQGGRQ